MTDDSDAGSVGGNRSDVWIFAGIFAAAAAVRAIPIGNDFWLDEIWTYFSVMQPDEMSADAFAKLIMVDYFYPAPSNPQRKARIEQAFGTLRLWFKKNLRDLKTK